MKQIIGLRKFCTNKKTALYSFHKDALNAKMVSFAGYEMPVQYDGVLKEHFQCRENSAYFDVSHMGQIKIFGKNRFEFLETLTVADIKNLQPQSSCLSVILNENAGIIDDCIITNMNDHFNVVLNAGNKYKDMEQIQNVIESHFKNQDIQVKTFFEEYSLIAIQGPKSQEVLQNLVNVDLSKIGFMQQVNATLVKENIQVALYRQGYTGEDGFEISVKSEDAEKLSLILLQNQLLKPAGLGARDSLRLEAGLCLHGHDITPETNPTEASLSWLVRKNQDIKFIGFDALKSHQKGKKRVGFVMNQPGTIREGQQILNDEDQSLGVVTSGTFSPMLKKGIGMAYVDQKQSKLGTVLKSKIRGKDNYLTITKMPFVQSNYYKK